MISNDIFLWMIYSKCMHIKAQMSLNVCTIKQYKDIYRWLNSIKFWRLEERNVAVSASRQYIDLFVADNVALSVNGHSIEIPFFYFFFACILNDHHEKWISIHDF